MTDSPEQKLIEAETVSKAFSDRIERHLESAQRKLKKNKLEISRIKSELAELREKAEVLPIIMKILSRAKRGKLASGNPAKWYGLSATHEEIEQLRQMIEQKERTHDQKN